MSDELPKLGKGEQADICFVLEGTYPYVRGGVSSWIHQLIENLPHYQFAIVFIGSAAKDYSGLLYQLPANVCHLEVHYLAGLSAVFTDTKAIHGSAAIEELVGNIYQHYYQTEHAPQEALPDIAELLGVGAARLRQEFSASILLWRFYRERYQQFYHHENFSHYFWSLRSMYTTLLGLLHIAEKVPQAHCIHSVSTGYAGALASFLRIVRRKPLVLTEHGIYTKERKIDIYSAPWGVEEQAVLPPGLNDRLSIQRRMWIRFFEDLGRLTYSASSVILTLYQANQQKQLDLGAPPERCLVVPNGVDLTRFSFLRKQRREGVPGVIALIGRVVRIKDIKNFIRTVGCLVDKIPGVQGWIVGPEDEDPEYVAECKALVIELGLQQQVYFLGFRKIEDILPKIGLLTLTSISEGQPLVVLEGFAAGIPAVTTDVGSCRELIEGRSHKDRKLGMAGAVVPIANPQAMALAAEKFLTDETAWLRAQEAAIARVESIYCESHLLNRYQRLYNKAISYGRNRV